MTKVILTLEGSTEELAPVLRLITSMSGTQVIEKAQQGKAIESEAPESPYWTEGKVRVVWRSITWECSDILKEIAKYEDGISWDQLLRNLKLKPNQVGGRLSSLGHQLRIHGYKILPNPLIPTANGSYKLDAVWRRTILKMREEMEAVEPDEGQE